MMNGGANTLKALQGKITDDNIIFEKEGDLWWVFHKDKVGEVAISFDKKKVYNLWTDFSKLSEKQKKVLEKSDKYWFDFFDRG